MVRLPAVAAVVRIQTCGCRAANTHPPSTCDGDTHIAHTQTGHLLRRFASAASPKLRLWVATWLGSDGNRVLWGATMTCKMLLQFVEAEGAGVVSVESTEVHGEEEVLSNEANVHTAGG